MKMLLVLSALILSPLFASAYQGSVSYACGTKQIKQFNLEGETFTTEALAQQGYTISVANGVVDLNQGTESVVIGTLQTLGECSYTAGLETAFISFNNLNLAIDVNVQQLNSCEAITTDGFYGVKLSTTFKFIALDSGYDMTLNSKYIQGYSSMEQCQAEHGK